MATPLAYTPVESIEGVSLLFRFFSHPCFLGEVGDDGAMTRRKESGDTGFTTRPAHSTLTALSHFQFTIPSTHSHI
jgi:hypothetical protein